MSNDIQRIDSNERLSRIVIHNGVVHVAGVTASDPNAAFADSTEPQRISVGAAMP